MPYNEIDSAMKGSQAEIFTDYSVDTQNLDSATSKETTWMNTKASQYLGYYKEIPELKIAIDTKATWTIGQGFDAEELTTLTLIEITGFGKDTFNSILENMIRNMHIYGDAYAEIIRDGEKFVNLIYRNFNIDNTSTPLSVTSF